MYHLCNKCQRPATQAQSNLCDRCWVQKYSKQWYNGKELTYAELFKTTIGAMGKQDDETREEWFSRCEAKVRKKGYAKSVIKSKREKPTEVAGGTDTQGVS